MEVKLLPFGYFSLVIGACLIASNVATSQELCTPEEVRAECRWLDTVDTHCATIEKAFAPDSPENLRQQLIDLSLSSRGSAVTYIDLVETRLIACGLAWLGEKVTARSILDDEITGLHADLPRYWQGANLLSPLADLIVAQYELGFRDDALRSLAMFDQLAGGAEPLDQVVLAQLALGRHMARLDEMLIADRYFASVERLWPLLPDHGEASGARVPIDTLLMIAQAQIEAGVYARADATLDRAELALAEAPVSDQTRSNLNQSLAALRTRLTDR